MKILLSLLMFIPCLAAIGAEAAPAEQVEMTVGDIAAKYPWADVRAFGAKGDGHADDSAAITNALSSPASIVVLPPGTYKILSGLKIPSGKSLRGLGVESTKIQYYGEGGTAIELGSGGGLSALKIESKGKDQNGIYIVGIHTIIRSVEVYDFGGIALRLGAAGLVGAYFSEIENVSILNTVNQGQTGLLVDGLSLPNSNANSFHNVFVKGKLTTMVHIKGNNNAWYGGDTEWDTSKGGVDDVWLIEGAGNIISGPYLEAGKGVPKRVFRFTSKANSNTVRDTYAQFVTENFSAKVIDEGFGNEFDFRPKGYYLPFPAQNLGIANIIPNSYFRSWAGDQPVGWAIKEGTFTRERGVVKGADYSLKAMAVSDNPIITCYVAGHRSSITGLSVGRFRGKTVSAGVWVRTAGKGMGNLKIRSDGKGGGGFGRDTHTGDDAWQLLTAIAKVPTDATYVALELRGFESGTGTGIVYFSEPTLVDGVHLPQPTPASLHDSHAKMTGPFIFNHPLIFADGDEQPIVKDGNVFKTSNTASTKIVALREGSAGQKITIIFADSNTMVDFTRPSLKGNRGLIWWPSNGDHMTCVYDGEVWYCDTSVNTQEVRQP